MTYTSSRKAEVIFPIRVEHVSNIFDGNRDVFVKFTKMRIEKGMVLIFYVSREKILIGQAKIKKVEKLDPDKAWDLYKDRIFLNKDEYEKYVGISPVSGEERKMKEISVFILSNVKQYDPPVVSTLPVTSSGRYLSRKKYNKFVKGDS